MTETRAGEERPVEDGRRSPDKATATSRPWRLTADIREIASSASAEERCQQPETALRSAEELFRSLVENVNDAVFSLDPCGVVTYVSPRAQQLSCFSAEELVGRSCLRLVHPEDAVRVRLALRAERASDLSGCHLRLIDKCGDVHHLRASASAIYEGGVFAGLIGSCTDIGELLQAREAIERAEERRRQAVSRLRATLDAAVQALARTVEFRDPYTAGHQQRSAQLSLAIGEQLALPKQKLEALSIGALIHDLGKISVPSEILTRPRALSEAERLILNEHPETGFSILAGLKLPGAVARIVREHHERLDGSGYPHHLAGDAICTESRVVAVADVVEAMSSHRPYRPSLGIEAALEFIGESSGTLFDPHMVRACIDLVESGFSFSAEEV